MKFQILSTPETHPREAITPCKRGCCWTPYGHSAQAKNCTCHADETKENA